MKYLGNYTISQWIEECNSFPQPQEGGKRYVSGACEGCKNVEFLDGYGSSGFGESSGSGYGYGDGSGSGSSYGDGDGSGSGSGSGYGYGYGDGSGEGYGYG